MVCSSFPPLATLPKRQQQHSTGVRHKQKETHMSQQPSSASFGQVAGGSFNEERVFGDPRFGCYQPGVKHLFTKVGKSFRVRILPARDLTYSAKDSAFPTSFVPYRDTASGKLDGHTKTPAFTGWYQMVSDYVMIGRSKISLLSPTTLSHFGVAGFSARDPLQMIVQFTKDHPRWGHLTKMKVGIAQNTHDFLPRAKSSAILNVLPFDQAGQPGSVSLLKLSYTSLEKLKAELSKPRAAVDRPVSSSGWADTYQFGDVTDPMTGLIGTVQDIPAGPVGTTSGILFSTHPTLLQGQQAYPIDPATPTGQKILSERYVFDSTTLKVLDPQSLVEWLVEDGFIDYELVQEALGSAFTIPPRPANNSVVSSPGGQPGLPAGAAPGLPSLGALPATLPPPPAAPAAATPPPLPATPPAPPPLPPVTPAAPPPVPVTPPPPPERTFWVSVSGAAPVLHVESAVLRLVASGAALQVCTSDNSSGWKTPAELGLVKLPPAAAPVVVAATAVLPATPAAAVPIPTPTPTTAASDGNALTDAEQQEMVVLTNSISSGVPPTPDQIARYMALVDRNMKYPRTAS